MRPPGSSSLAGAVIVTAADRGYFPMLQGLLRSISRQAGLSGAAIAVFDVGLDVDQQESLVADDVRLLRPRSHLGVTLEGAPPIVPSILVRPFLDEYLPEFDCHIWIDADAWIQDGQAIARLRDGAMSAGLAVAHEGDPDSGAALLEVTAHHEAVPSVVPFPAQDGE